MAAESRHFDSAFDHISLDDTSCRSAQKCKSSETNYLKNERIKWSKKLDFILSAVGYAVGFGNIWRFPYLCYSNGGGAFLIPYFVMMSLAGLPLFYMELALGQYASLGPIAVWKVCPIFAGIGWTMIGLNLLVSIYYNVILTLSIFYLFASFTSSLPWATCGNFWNKHCLTDSTNDNTTYHSDLKNVTSQIDNTSLITADLSDILTSTSSYNYTSSSSCSMEFSATTFPAMINESFTYKSAAEEFWLYYVLGIDDDTNISHIGEVRWHLVLCHLVSWMIVLLCIIRGIKSSGKVVYFTATFPYLVLLILFVRGISLPGALEGIKFYLVPDFSKMASVKVWNDAAIQILFSLGPGFGGLIMLGSYNNFHNRCDRDAIMVTLINCFTSVFAGFVIFSVIGFMSVKHGVAVAEVADKGPGLAFIAYPEALSMMPGAPFWSISFFFMLFTLGLDSQFVGVESIITGLVDIFPKIAKWKKLFTASLCAVLFLAGIPCVTQGGMFVVELIDQFTMSYPLLVVTLLETIAICWVYGIRRFSRDVQIMLGIKPNYFWMGCWSALTPAIIIFIFIFKCMEYKGLYYGSYRYPYWSEGVGWGIVFLLIGFIPLAAVWKFCQCVGSVQKFWWVATCAVSISVWKLHNLWSPGSDWGPDTCKENKAKDQALQEDNSDIKRRDSSKDMILPLSIIHHQCPECHGNEMTGCIS